MKTWLITKSEHLASAKAAFSGTNVNITTEGRPYLGVPLGTKDYCDQFVENKVKEWGIELEKLCSIAESQPHAAYAAATHGLAGKWTYLARTVPNLETFLLPLEEIIRKKLIPALSGRPPPNDQERDFLALPARLGGIGLGDPSKRSSQEFLASLQVTNPLKNLISDMNKSYTYEAYEEQVNAKAEIHNQRRSQQSASACLLKPLLPISLQRSMALAQERGASSWLTALPVTEFGFTLHKCAFRDALCLRYGWLPARTPINCDCGTQFSVEHALSCPKGGFPSLRHNEIRDMTADILTEVCNDVCIEPHLQPVTVEHLQGASSNTQDGARLDIAANGLWGGRFERTFFDVRVFNPHAPSNRHTNPSACYRKHEKEKKRAYEQRILQIEHASFTPLVMSSTGGLGPAATSSYKRLATLLAAKWNQPYSSTLSWLRCRLSFSLLRSSIQAIRGARSSNGRAQKAAHLPVDLMIVESRVDTLTIAEH